MEDPHKSKIGIVSDGTRRGTLIVDTNTDKWPERFPPVQSLKYEKSPNTIMQATLKIAPMPVRIKGIVTSANWLRMNANDKWEDAGADYVPPAECNPVGRWLHVECAGTFAELSILHDETDAVFRNISLVGLTWECDPTAETMFSLHLTCLILPYRKR